MYHLPGHSPPLQVSMIILIFLLTFNVSLALHELTSINESRNTASLAALQSYSPHSSKEAFFLLSDGIEIKTRHLYNDSIAVALSPLKLSREKKGERIVLLKSVQVNNEICKEAPGDTDVHLFWLQSNPWKLFHSLVDVSAKKLINIHQLILPSLANKLPKGLTSVSYFDVTRNCDKCGENVTFTLILVDESSSKIVLLTLDSHLQVTDIGFTIETRNPGKVSLAASPSSSLTWIEDSSCLKQSMLLSASESSSSTRKLFCVNEYSSEAVVTDFYQGQKGDYIYVLTATGDVLRISASTSSVDLPYQLLITSDMYSAKDIHEQHATTFNTIYVLESHSSSNVSIFLSVKSSGVILRLDMHCISDGQSHDVKNISLDKHPCKLIYHSPVLVEHQLLDFQIVDDTLTHCATFKSHESLAAGPKASPEILLNQQNASGTLATVSAKQPSIHNKTPEERKSNVGMITNSVSRSIDDSSLPNKPWDRLVIALSLSTLVVSLSMGILIYYVHRYKRRSHQQDFDSSGDSSSYQEAASGGDDSYDYYSSALEGNSNECSSMLPSTSSKTKSPTAPRAKSCENADGISKKGKPVSGRRCIRGRPSPPKNQTRSHDKYRAVESKEARREGLTFSVAIEDIGNGFANPSFASDAMPNVSTTAPLKWKEDKKNTGTRGHRYTANVTTASSGATCGDCSYKSECKEMGICLNTYRLLNPT